MPPTTVFICGGCRKKMNTEEYLNCSECANTYDLECANVAVLSFRKTMTKKHKSQWICFECRNKQPKTSNIDTPVRALHATISENSPIGDDDTAGCDNITLRGVHGSKRGCRDGSSSPPIYDEVFISTICERVLNAIKSEVPIMLTTVLQHELLPIKNELQDFRTSLDFYNARYEEMKNELCVLKNENDTLKTNCALLETSVRDLSERLNNTEQYLRENNLEIHGVPEYQNENLMNLVIQCSSVIGSDVKVEDLITCTRVAKVNKNSIHPRTIVAKFRNVACRDKFYSAVYRYNKANANDKLNTSVLGLGGDKKQVYISEHLSPTNKHLHAAARKKVRELNYQFIWIRNGRIFVRKTTDSSYIHIKNVNSLALIK